MALPGRLLDLGLSEYQETLELQRAIHEARAADRVEDTLILTEHLPVYTLGRTWRPEHLGHCYWEEAINKIPVHATDRGGSVTYHGPGQLVGYPILRLRQFCQGPKDYMRTLEEVLIRGLAVLGIEAIRRSGFVGVWVENRKIAAMGVRISRGVTRHGFALNVTNDLSAFSAILPCGLVDCHVTSIAAEKGRNCAMDTIKEVVVQSFEKIFGLSLIDESSRKALSLTGSEHATTRQEGN